jgi:hypothetical protein
MVAGFQNPFSESSRLHVFRIWLFSFKLDNSNPDISVRLYDTR